MRNPPTAVHEISCNSCDPCPILHPLGIARRPGDQGALFPCESRFMTVFLQYIINGLVVGGAYALIGIGLTLVLGIMKVVNFAHGEMYMLGAYFLFTFFTKMGVNFYLAMALAIASVMLLGFVYERAILKPLRRRSIDTVMLSMIG